MWAVAMVAVLVGLGVGWSIARLTSGEPPRSSAESFTPVDAGPGAADLLEEHRVGVVVIDQGGSVRYRNPIVRRWVGTHVGVLLDEAVERHGEIARNERASGETIEIYGPPKTVLVIEAHPIPTGGSVVYVEDVSERRRIDQIRTDFVANISHELKTPVGALSVLAQTLDGESDPDTIERIVGRMIDEAERASRTIDDLLELSQIELRGEPVTEPVTIDEIIEGAIDRVGEMCARRGIGVSSLGAVDQERGDIGKLRILGDRRQLISALGNLVENAVKYSPDGSVVHVRSTTVDGTVELSVIDRGVGIPQRDLDRIFERFYRVDRARSRSTGGTGLGLSIVRHVATNHGGDVRVESTEGEGSTFVLRLPLDRADVSPADNSEGVA